MRLPREPYKASEYGALAVAEKIERADGFALRKIEDAMGEARDRYQTIVMAV